MKKLYIEILKISLVFVLGLCTFGILNQVEATDTKEIEKEKNPISSSQKDKIVYEEEKEENSLTKNNNLMDANGVKFKKGNYVRYYDITKEYGWNLRNGPNLSKSTIIGEMKSGTIFLVTEVLEEESCLKIKIIEGNLEGKQGYIKITGSSKANFKILKDYNTEPQPKEETELQHPTSNGIKGIIEKVLNAIMNFFKNLFKSRYEIN